MGVAAFAVLLPFAVASAGPFAAAGRGRAPADATHPGDALGPVASSGDPSERRDPVGVGGRAEQCGPELASADGVEAQTCVISQAGSAWARTYYRNATGDVLRAVLTLMAPGGRTVRTHCRIVTGDEPGICETPREPVRGGAGTAVAEFAGARDDGPLLLRSGSNSPGTGGR
ncbi:hypothetical protein DSC45_26855 [Streptomyces sp. YIM 130001]|nr:hypothetical protein DSC45_26855 [Streptomyces sp. YIM 130001]